MLQHKREGGECIGTEHFKRISTNPNRFFNTSHPYVSDEFLVTSHLQQNKSPLKHTNVSLSPVDIFYPPSGNVFRW